MEGSEPIFLTLAEVLDLHRTSLARHGGTDGLRDNHLLRSALAQPEASFGGTYLHVNLYEMAAAYLFHLTQNHPFVDGNKRIGLAVALAFLWTNGIVCTASNKEVVALTLTVARGELDKPAIAAIFRQHNRKR